MINKLYQKIIFFFTFSILVTAQSQALIDTAYAAYYSQRDYQKAAPLFEELSLMNPTFADYFVRAAFAYYRIDEFPNAINNFKKAINVGPWPDIYCYYIANSYALMKDVSNTIAWLLKSVEFGWPDYLELAENENFFFIEDTPEYKEIFGKTLKEDADRNSKWIADLEFIYDKMKLLHFDIFNRNARSVWDNKFDEIKKDIPRLSDDQITVSFLEFAALAGEGHTKVLPKESGNNGFHSLPIELYIFNEGIFVKRAFNEYKDMVGKKVVLIGNKSVQELYDESYKFRGHENIIHHKKMAPEFLTMMETLKNMGAIDNIDSTTIVLENRNGEKELFTLESKLIESVEDLPKDYWFSMNDAADQSQPLYLQNEEKDFWFKYLPQQKTMYLFIRYILNNDEIRFSSFIDSVFTEFDKYGAEKLIVDLRMCGGGNSYYNKYLIEEIIKRPKLNKYESLFTIIGRVTYSAAINLAADLDYRTQTTFVGEPTGSSPNFIGESNVLKLPYSDLYLIVSNRYHQGGENNSLDKRPWIAPSVLIELSSEDFRTNKDPVLEYLLYK